MPAASMAKILCLVATLSRGLQVVSEMPAAIDAECMCWSTAKQPKATILSVVFGLSREYVETLRTNRALEADSFGYEYCEFSHELDKTRDPAWGKVKAIQELMARGREKLIWMDADAFFTQVKSFEEVTQRYLAMGRYPPSPSIILTDDIPTGASPVNSGVFVQNSTGWVKEFWRSVYNDFNDTVAAGCWPQGCYEQRAIYQYMQKNPTDFAKNAAIISHHSMNEITQTTADFIAHKAGGHGHGPDGHSAITSKYDNLLIYVRDANSKLQAKLQDPARSTSSLFTNKTASEHFHVKL